MDRRIKKATHEMAMRLRAIYPAEIAAERAANISCALRGVSFPVVPEEFAGIWSEVEKMVFLRRERMLGAVTMFEVDKVMLEAFTAYFKELTRSDLGTAAILAVMGAPTKLARAMTLARHKRELEDSRNVE